MPRPVHNERVTSVQKVCRPMGSSGAKSVPLVPHCGVKATTSSGNSYLVHKGPKFDTKYGGSAGTTVVTPAKNMSSKWEAKGAAKPVSNGTRVGDLVKAGGPKYNVVGGNCLQASNKMIGNATKGKK